MVLVTFHHCKKEVRNIVRYELTWQENWLTAAAQAKSDIKFYVPDWIVFDARSMKRSLSEGERSAKLAMWFSSRCWPTASCNSSMNSLNSWFSQNNYTDISLIILCSKIWIINYINDVVTNSLTLPSFFSSDALILFWAYVVILGTPLVAANWLKKGRH